MLDGGHSPPVIKQEMGLLNMVELSNYFQVNLPRSFPTPGLGSSVDESFVSAHGYTSDM